MPWTRRETLSNDHSREGEVLARRMADELMADVCGDVRRDVRSLEVLLDDLGPCCPLAARRAHDEARQALRAMSTPR